MTRRQFVKTAAATMSVATAGSALAAQGRGGHPNIVYVFADQMRAHAMGCMGNKQVITPHLDRIAGEGPSWIGAVFVQRSGPMPIILKVIG